MQNTQLLDAYLQGTAHKGGFTTHTYDQLDHSSRTAQPRHSTAVSSAAEAQDDLINVSSNSRDTSGQQQTWLGALADRKSICASTSNKQQGPASPAGRQTSSSGGLFRGGQQPKGIFRSMREADAAALHELQSCASQQQPIFQAPADNSNGTVRIIASSVALQAKLQRLQAQMEAKSYRQELLQQLHMSGAVFQPSVLQPQQQQPQHQQQDDYQWLRSSDTKVPSVLSGLGDRDGATRPTTSPACMGTMRQEHTATAVYAGGTRAGGMHGSLAPTQSSSLRRSSDQQQLQHLKELVDYEPPWPAHAQTAGNTKRHNRTGSEAPGSVFRHAGHQRPWTSMGLSAQQNTLQTSQVGSQAGLQSSSTMSAARAVQRHSDHNRQEVPRPASAVAALEQSLSELAVLRSKYHQDQQQVKQRLQQQQQDTGQDVLHSNSPSSSTWLQDPRLQHVLPAVAPRANDLGGMPAAVVPALAPCQPSAAVDPYCSEPPASQGLSSFTGARQQVVAHMHPAACPHSRPHGYKIWDSWQQYIHNPASVAAAATAAGDSGYSTRHVAVRPVSASRPVRAWDAIPLPRTSVTGVAYPARSRRCSSPGYSRGSQLQRQQQHRPKTAGGYECLVGEQFGQRADGVRPLGLHNETVGAARPATAAAVLKQPQAVSNQAGRSASSWLVSSPLRRRQQQSTTTAAGTSSVRRSLAVSTGRQNAGTRVTSIPGNSHAASTAVGNNHQPPGVAVQASISMSSPVKVQGRATAAAVQLLRQLRDERASASGADVGKSVLGIRSTTTAAAAASSLQATYAARLSAAGGSRRNTAVPAGDGLAAAVSAGGVEGQGPLTQKVLEYAAKQYKSPYARRKGVSDRDSDSSSDTTAEKPAVKSRQSSTAPSAYAAVLARVKAAKAAGHSSDSDSD